MKRKVEDEYNDRGSGSTPYQIASTVGTEGESGRPLGKISDLLSNSKMKSIPY
jgi:hypothetical protein